LLSWTIPETDWADRWVIKRRDSAVSNDLNIDYI
jgi:hypothetical protein